MEPLDDVNDERIRTDAEKNSTAGAALVELSQKAHSVTERGTGPLKWLVLHAWPWFTARVAWLWLYMVASSLNFIKAGFVFPLVFVNCVLKKYIWWLFYDVGYRFGWEGEWEQLAGNFKNIGKCSPWMWEAIGFDSNATVIENVYIQPGFFASDLTGVRHPILDGAQLCKKMTCGRHAACVDGACICDAGYRPDTSEPGHCELSATSHGCVCLAGWKESGIFSTYYGSGCSPVRRRCRVDKDHTSYETCRRTLPHPSTGLIGWLTGWTGHLEDSCTPAPYRARVPAMS